jgi:hypothetical protein
VFNLKIKNTEYKMEEANKITKIKIMDLNPSKFDFSPGKSSVKFRKLCVDLNSLVVKFNKLRIPFDSKVNMYGNLDINLSLQHSYTKVYTAEELTEKLRSIDTYIQDLAKKENWLEYYSNSRYNSIVKESKNSNFAPTIKAKYDTYTSKFYDENTKEISISDQKCLTQFLSKGTLVLTSIEFSGLYFNEKTWGMTMKYYHTKIYKKEPIQEPDQPIDNLEFVSDSE